MSWSDPKAHPTVQLNPKNASSYDGRALAYYALGKVQKSYDDYSKAIELDPKNSRYYFSRGEILEREGYDDSAFKDFNKVIELEPMNSRALSKRGDYFIKKKKYVAAYKDLSRVTVLDPGNEEAYYGLGYIHYVRNLEYKAIKYLDKAIMIDPKYTSAYFLRARIHGKIKKYSKSVDDFSKAINYKPDHFQAYRYRGMTYFIMDEYNNAIKDLKKAIQLKPKYRKELMETIILCEEAQKRGKVVPLKKRRAILVSLVEKLKKNKIDKNKAFEIAYEAAINETDYVNKNTAIIAFMYLKDHKKHNNTIRSFLIKTSKMPLSETIFGKEEANYVRSRAIDILWYYDKKEFINLLTGLLANDDHATDSIFRNRMGMNAYSRDPKRFIKEYNLNDEGDGFCVSPKSNYINNPSDYEFLSDNEFIPLAKIQLKKKIYGYRYFNGYIFDQIKVKSAEAKELLKLLKIQSKLELMSGYTQTKRLNGLLGIAKIMPLEKSKKNEIIAFCKSEEEGIKAGKKYFKDSSKYRSLKYGLVDLFNEQIKNRL
ncbi:MAG: tetratricopeptide repeat protein [Desulfobacterales bacterium]|nr:tetratricopeptide repeat protein [Desulfobacterales bacterium]